MKPITDEMLNKYIDGELTSAELSELNDLLANDEEAVKKLKALKLADQLLKKMEETPAPENFTNKLMSKIVPAATRKAQSVSGVFIGVISFFFLSIIGIIGFSISQLSETENSVGISSEAIDKAKNFVSQNSGTIMTYLTDEKVLFVGGMLSFILLLGLYFMVHSHKSFRDSIERFGS